MTDTYLILVIVLFALAIFDLVVGVSNDAVNFLNSAIGSKVAKRRVIMVVASIGIFLGAALSDGMMEVARKGVFYPENFFFEDIMVVFLAVMILSCSTCSIHLVCRPRPRCPSSLNCWARRSWCP